MRKREKKKKYLLLCKMILFKSIVLIYFLGKF